MLAKQGGFKAGEMEPYAAAATTAGLDAALFAPRRAPGRSPGTVRPRPTACSATPRARSKIRAPSPRNSSPRCPSTSAACHATLTQTVDGTPEELSERVTANLRGWRTQDPRRRTIQDIPRRGRRSLRREGLPARGREPDLPHLAGGAAGDHRGREALRVRGRASWWPTTTKSSATPPPPCTTASDPVRWSTALIFTVLHHRRRVRGQLPAQRAAGHVHLGRVVHD